MLTITIKDLLNLSKHTNIFKSDLKVFTPSGFKKIYDVQITAKNSKVYQINTKKHELLCSPKHLIKSNNNWIETQKFKIGDIIETKSGDYEITELKLLNLKKDLLDLHVEGNEYYTNDIVSHNSALLSSFEYALYGKVRGRKRKFATIATLPNRINGELLNKIKFNSNGTEVEIHRGISPNILKLYENGILNDRAGKSNLDEKIVDYIGIDLETYNSFISMSINDFKNFISLTSEEKQILLDKLFNLDIINDLNVILKELNASNKKQLIKYDSEINSFNESLDSIKRSIDKSLLTEN